ncbi:Highly reducing polyketide synthase cm3B [Cladobotryum mycophilum]|uniref:Highly reducing polyketide synthase cm3B n=1 Tax=Cladobotryum mycophilum TaxID=491253 RepID=A0ABR0SNK7_9HYPO
MTGPSASASSSAANSHRLDAAVMEPIAVIGAACRFSGNASSQDGLWQLLSKNMTSWGSNARGRFRLESFWHPHAQLSGSVNSRGLHLLQQDPAVFDNDFFGISGLEAKAIDPNQRLMLEVAYETFENAGISLEGLEGSNTGVVCAVPYIDYDQIQGRDPEVSPRYRFTGTGPSILANRVSYFFDLKGPSMSVDTACSSTLVALHEACRALRAGDADQILVGGSNLILDPDKLTNISSMQFLSPHGRCYSFDSRASGYGRGEGVAGVLLKPLTAAIRDGDTIRAVIRGSATGSDGRTHGITMPSPTAQYETIRRAYQSAGLDPRDTLYVEAHGTGTNAGDDCEIKAFTNAFCKDRPNKLLIGSVKANLGHTEGVAGLAGLIKTILMLEKGLIAPNPLFSSANPNLELEARGIQVPTKIMKWPEGSVRRVSINGTGYGGVNAHVIVEAWPKANHIGGFEHGFPMNGITPNAYSKERSNVFVWSHQREDGLVKMASTWKRFIMASRAGKQHLSLDDMAFTLGSRRSHLGHRAAIIASDLQELLDGINKIELGSIRPVKAFSNAKLCFVFTGQGAQWARMGVELMSVYTVFSQSLHRSEVELLRQGATWRLTEELKKPEEASRINTAELAQPCCTAVQIALVDLLASWDVHPDMVCGHSSGEIAAAYAAGALTAEEAVKTAYFRGQAVCALKKGVPHMQGGMLAVGLSESDVREYLVNHQDAVKVACINSPSSVTLSGDVAAIDQLIRVFNSARIFNRKLAVDVAYHSHHMAYVEAYYRASIHGLKPQKIYPQVRMVSSVTGKEVQGQELDSAYWTRNLLNPVRFSDALAGLLRPKGKSVTAQSIVMLEIGPHAALKGPANQTIKSLSISQPIHYTSCLKRGESAKSTSLLLATELHTHGVTVDLNRVNNPENMFRKVLANLPSYNWHHENVHWNESRRSAVYRTRKFPRHELLGNATTDSISAEPSWRVYVKLSEMPWVSGHCIDGQIVFAASGFVSMIIEAMKRHCLTTSRPWRRKVVQLKDVIIERPLLIQNDEFGAEVFTLLRPYSHSSRQSNTMWQEFRIFSVSKRNESTEHCRGLIAVSDSVRKLTMTSHLDNVVDDEANPWNQLAIQKMYKDLHSVGNEYSGCFASLSKVAARAWGTKCELVVPDVKLTMPSQHQQQHCLHPTTLEACVQACLPGLQAADCMDGAQVVTGFDEIYVSTDIDLKPGQTLAVTTKTAPYGLRHHAGDFVVKDLGKEARPIIRVKGIKYSSLGTYGTRSATSAAYAEEPLCHQMEWLMDPFASPKLSVERYCKEGLIEDNQQFRKLCDPFCQSVINRTLSQLTPEDEEGITGHLQMYLKWMRSHHVPDAEPIDLSIEESMRALGAPGEMLVTHSDSLADILRGKMQSVCLFEGDLHYSLYVEDQCLKRCYLQLAKYLRLVQFKVPNLRILEIGGGTASMAVSLLETMYGNQQEYPNVKWTYVFTDAVTSLIPEAQARLKKFESFMDFKRLDIERCPSQQGFELASFDIIVTSNVVHMTRSVKGTLANLKRLLKPGGQIAMVELTEPSLRWGLLGGGLPGWWLGAEDGRGSFPLLNKTQWDDALSQSGFSGVSLEMKDYDAEEQHEASLIISHAVNSNTQTPPKEVVIIAGGSDGVIATELRDRLQAQYPELDVSVQPLSGAARPNAAYIFMLEMSWDFLLTPSGCDWSSVRDVICRAQAVLWVTKGAALTCTEPQRALITGLGRTLRSEKPGLKFYTLDLDPGCSQQVETVSHITQVYEQFLGSNASPHSSSEWEIAIRDGCVMVPRLLDNKAVNHWVEDTFSKHHPRETKNINPNRSLGLRIHSAGMLDSLYWVDHPTHSQPPTASQIKVRVDNISLNFKDVMTAMGQLEGQSTLLIEGSGTVLEVGDTTKSSFSAGDKVCFFAPEGLATVSNIDVNHASLVPKGMSMETAASIPVAYATALYALRDVGRLGQGDSVLIHSGAGAVGQAAIAIAQFLGVEDIFVTAGSEERRKFVREKFGIPANRILSSRNLDFGDQILELNGGRGVDVVLNSLSGDTLAASLGALASFGRFVEIGKKDILTNGRLEMKYFEKNISFSAVDLTLVAKDRSKMMSKLLRTCVKLVQERTLDMLEPITSAPAAEAEKQFRAMQAGNHIGKLILKMNSSQTLKVQPPKPKQATLREDGSYLVVGSSRGLHKDVVKYLAKLGAKRTILLSRSGAEETGMEQFTKDVQALGSELVILRGSIRDKSLLQRLKEASNDMPIRGVIQGVMPQQSMLMEFTTRLQWYQNNTALGTLDLFAEIGKDLDFFLLLGSAAAVIGTHGQGNYCASNTFQDAFARYQASLGCPVRAIDVGLVQDEDVSFENSDLLAKLSSHGLQPHSKEELFSVLNYAIQNPVAETTAQAQILCGTRRTVTEGSSPDAKFSHLWAGSTPDITKTSDNSDIDVQSALQKASTSTAAVEATYTSMKQKLARLLAISPKEVQPDRSVASYGVDSLISVELRNWITGHLRSHVQTLELMSSMDMMQLAEVVAKRSRFVPVGTFPGASGKG